MFWLSTRASDCADCTLERFLRRHSQKMTARMMRTIPRAAPTPIAAFAPVLSPADGDDTLEMGLGVGVDMGGRLVVAGDLVAVLAAELMVLVGSPESKRNLPAPLSQQKAV